MTILYFAWVRQGIGAGEETLALPPQVRDGHALLAHLRSLSPNHARALGDESRLRLAVNRRHVPFDTAIAEGDEVAIFPPVTGG